MRILICFYSYIATSATSSFEEHVNVNLFTFKTYHKFDYAKSR